MIIDGRQIKGRSVIAQGHQQIFDTIYRDSVNHATVRDVRFLGPDVALAHVEWQLRLAQSEAASVGRAINTIIFERAGGAWQIAAFHNSPIAAAHT